MYNLSFQVKYNEIKKDLLFKFHDKHKLTETDYVNEESNNAEENKDYDYTEKDIIDITGKLYCDELSSVFYAEDIMDDKIDIGMKRAFEMMIEYNEFGLLIQKIKDILIKDINYAINEENMDIMIRIALFSEYMFYLTHDFICQRMNVGKVEPPLLLNMEKMLVQILEINM